jgi:hypothetical protein
MLDENRRSPMVRIRNFLCFLLLALAVFSEGYTAAAISLDRFVPHWYRTVGRLLFVLPCALAFGLLLFYANLRRLGFCLCATSLSLYAVVIFLDLSQGRAERGDWIFVGGWLAFCAVGIFAARLLMGKPTPS